MASALAVLPLGMNRTSVQFVPCMQVSFDRNTQALYGACLYSGSNIRLAVSVLMFRTCIYIGPYYAIMPHYDPMYRVKAYSEVLT